MPRVLRGAGPINDEQWSVGGAVTIRFDRIVTTGTFSLDDHHTDVENNVWLVGDDDEVLVVDAAHDAPAILDAIDGRRVVAVVSTHGHNDHINAAGEIADATGAPVYLHPEDRMLWDEVHPDRMPLPLSDGQRFQVAGTTLEVLHTPGHSPGAVCLHAVDVDVILTGDTLIRGGPGDTGPSFSSFHAIMESIRTRLLYLPRETRVLAGHGEETTIGEERPDYDVWVRRGS